LVTRCCASISTISSSGDAVVQVVAQLGRRTVEGLALAQVRSVVEDRR
jgi:hypothetical protein